MDYDLDSETRMMLYAAKLKRRSDQRAQLNSIMSGAAGVAIAAIAVYLISRMLQ